MSLKPISTGNDSGLPLFSFYITVVFDPVVFSSIRKMEIFFFELYSLYSLLSFLFSLFSLDIFYFRIIIRRVGIFLLNFRDYFLLTKRRHFVLFFFFYSNRIEK